MSEYRPRIKRTYTLEAIIVFLVVSLMVGFLVGVAMCVLANSWQIGVIAGAGMFGLSCDIIFRGTNE